MKIAWLALVALFCGFRAVAAEGKSTSGDCSVKYGELMVQHWLTVDLARQAERGIGYLPGEKAASARNDFKKLRLWLQTAEARLDEARAEYKNLLATNSPGRVIALSKMLEEIASDEEGNEKLAESVLRSVGESAQPKIFNPLPVRNEALAPAWDPKWIGKDFRPKRILFGSTGRAGDDRTLALKFDFGSGIFGFFAPMAESNKLQASEKILDQTDPLFVWMKNHGSGYHYWAGVYNNQNTYLAPWFLKAHGSEEDIWMKLADGKVMKGGEWGQVNIWNPNVRAYIQNYCETQARALGKDPFLVCYDYTGEPHPTGAQSPGQAQYTGYNETAIQAFRDYLKNKFKTIQKLNQAWESSYADFSAIEPPPDKYLSPPEKASALSYEFERFRCDSHAQYWKLVYDAYRKYDHAKPIEANAGMYMSGWPVEGLDSWELQKAGVADWVDMHMNNFWPNLAEQIYLYSLCRLSGRVPVEFEYVWTFPRTGPVAETNESDFRATCEASVFRNLVWGKKALVFFDFYYDWPAYHNAFFDQQLGYSILRPSGCVVPVTKRKALRFNDILMQTEVATPRIIVLEPTTSELNSPPLHPNQSFGYHSGVAGKDVHELLFPRNYPFLYVPEGAVLDGYALRQHKVIILPQAPCFPEKLDAKLLNWIKEGGTLISVGVPGIWDAYGKADLRLVNEVFGKSEVRDAQPGKWKWNWELKEPSRNVLWQANCKEKKVTAAQATYGKGRALVCTGPFDTPELQSRFYETLDSAIGRKPASCGTNAFELVLREDGHGRRYLFALNPHTREVREDEVTVVGHFSHCSDLGVGTGVPVPARVTQNETSFRLRLYPGEGTVIALVE